MLTFSQWINGITGLVGVAIGLLAWLGVIQWPVTQLVSSILGAVGILMVNMVTQEVLLAERLRKIEEGMGGSRVTFLSKLTEGPGEYARRAAETEEVIRDVVINWKDADDQTARDPYRNRRDERVRRGKVELSQIVRIYHKKHFIEVLGMVARFGSNPCYNLRYLEVVDPPQPGISLTIFDHKHLYLSTIHDPVGKETDRLLYTTDPEQIAWYLGYWNALWGAAPWLTSGTSTNLDALKNLGKKLKPPIDETQFKELWDEAQAAAESGIWKDAKLGPRRQFPSRRQPTT